MLFSQTPLLPFFSINEVFLDPDTSTADQVFDEDWRRIGFVLQNVGSNDIYLRAERPATIGEGFRLEPSDPPLEILFKDYGPLPSRSWFAVSGAMISTLFGYQILYTPKQHGHQLP